MEYIREIAIYILFTILFIIIAIDITIIVRKTQHNRPEIRQNTTRTSNDKPIFILSAVKPTGL